MEITSIDKKKELFKSAQKWIVKTFVNYKAVVQAENEELGLFVLKSKFQMPKPDYIKTTEDINFTITIDCKDGKCRIIVDDFINKVNLGKTILDFPVGNKMVIEEPEKPGEKKDLDQLKRFRVANEYIRLEIEDIISSLKQTMVKKDDF